MTYKKTEKDISGQISFKDLIITPPANARYYKAIMRNGESGDITPSMVTTAKPMLVIGNEIKTYEEYNKDKQTVLTTAKFGDKYININQINEI